MTLKEARKMANENRRMPLVPDSSCNATVILDDRITELEECLRDLKYAVIKEFGGLGDHSIHVKKAIEKACQMLNIEK